MKISVFWVVALCSLVDVNKRFRGHTASVIKAMNMPIGQPTKKLTEGGGLRKRKHRPCLGETIPAQKAHCWKW
jgi:hypothetical protein